MDAFDAKVHNAFNTARFQMDYLSDHVRLNHLEREMIRAMMRELDGIHHDFMGRCESDPSAA